MDMYWTRIEWKLTRQTEIKTLRDTKKKKNISFMNIKVDQGNEINQKEKKERTKTRQITRKN